MPLFFPDFPSYHHDDRPRIEYVERGPKGDSRTSPDKVPPGQPARRVKELVSPAAFNRRQLRREGETFSSSRADSVRSERRSRMQPLLDFLSDAEAPVTHRSCEAEPRTSVEEISQSFNSDAQNAVGNLRAAHGNSERTDEQSVTDEVIAALTQNGMQVVKYRLRTEVPLHDEIDAPVKSESRFSLIEHQVNAELRKHGIYFVSTEDRASDEGHATIAVYIPTELAVKDTRLLVGKIKNVLADYKAHFKDRKVMIRATENAGRSQCADGEDAQNNLEEGNSLASFVAQSGVKVVDSLQGARGLKPRSAIFEGIYGTFLLQLTRLGVKFVATESHGKRVLGVYIPHDVVVEDPLQFVKNIQSVLWAFRCQERDQKGRRANKHMIQRHLDRRNDPRAKALDDMERDALCDKPAHPEINYEAVRYDDNSKRYRQVWF